MKKNNTVKSIFGISSISLATAAAILFHVIGLAGILFFNKEFFIKLTSLNLLLMFALILFTQQEKNSSFFLFIIISFVIGIIVELIGTRTGILFGEYTYGEALGPSFFNVPFIIGLNWFMVIYCCGVSMNLLLEKFNEHAINKIKPRLKTLSFLVDGATIAVALDWLMEPVAVDLGYWKWSGDIPVFNYACWFMVSLALLFLFRIMKFEKENKFAVHLLLIQAMFFLLLRTFL